MKIGVVIQARMTSTRLPGKVLMPIYKSKSMLELVVERVSRCKLVDEIIIATTKNQTDDPIIQLCKQLGIKYHRGSEDNVLERYYEAAQKFELDVIIRITSDCPVIDWETIDRIIEAYQTPDVKYDYVSNIIERTYPRGLDTELMTFKTLEKTYKMAETMPEKEHVTRRILVTHPEEYRKLNIENNLKPVNEQSISEFRLTVDTIEDKELIGKIYEKLDKIDFNQKELIDLLINNPELLKINQNIKQKII